MKKTTFRVSKMDCPSEEQMIRMRLEGFQNVSSMEFDIPDRRLDVYHAGDYELIFEALDGLGLNSKFVETQTIDHFPATDDTAQERRLLWQVLFINIGFFALEMLAGVVSNSMGLMADSLDMLADGLVYGMALFAVGGALARKKKIARISGYFQLFLALAGFVEVVRRFSGFGQVPAFQVMIVVSMLALVGNSICLYLLQKSKNREAHMQASVIFTSNDVAINIGVVIAGALVFLTSSKFPDLFIGTIVFVIVARGAFKILQAAK